MKTHTPKKPNTRFAKMFTAMLTLLSLACLAQEDIKKESRHFYGGFGYSNFILQQVNHSALNKELKSNGYGGLGSSNYAFGGGGMFCVRNFLIGGGGAWILDSQTQNTLHTLSMEGGYGFFSLGYIAYNRRNFFLYPLIGAGGGGYSLKIAKKDAGGNFSQQLNSPASMSEMQAGGLVTDVSVNAQFFFRKKSCEGFFCGLRAGYRLTPQNWNFSNQNASTNGPKVNMNGVYFSVILGGGSLTK